MDDAQRSRAAALRFLHTDDALLVLPNVWDAASARTVAAVDGVSALATASWAIAAAHGLPDGEAIAREDMIDAVDVITGAVELPVSADLEAGYGDPAETVSQAIDAGAVGCNLEDAGMPGGLVDAVAHADAVAAVRSVDPDFVINARTDVYLQGLDSLDEALSRGRLYLEAGADCVFVPGVRDEATIASLVEGMGGPVSLLVGGGSPSLARLGELGVARVTFGPGLMGVAMAALRDVAAGLVGGGELPDALGFRPGAS